MVTTTKKKAPHCPYHNYIKTKALYYLSKCERPVTSAAIAKAINANPNSLYVLLGRWYEWGIVKRYLADIDSINWYLYALAPKGRAWLRNLDRWYIYQDKAFSEVDQRLRMKSWVIGYVPGPQGSKGQFHVIRYPYEDVNRDYLVVDNITGDGYFRQVNTLDDFFEAAQEYKNGPINRYFADRVRTLILKAIRSANAS